MSRNHLNTEHNTSRPKLDKMGEKINLKNQNVLQI